MRTGTHRLADLFPGFLESKDRGVGEGSTDLEDTVEVVQAPADVGDGGPLFDDRHAFRGLPLAQYFGRDGATHIVEPLRH